MDADPLVQIWRASASGRALNREDVENFKVKHATDLLHRENLSLRAEGHFVFGLSQIWAARAALLLQDSQATDEGIGSAFREYLTTISPIQSQLGSEDHHRSAQLHDFDLDELVIPNSLVSEPMSQPMSSSDEGFDHSVLGYSPGRAGDLSMDLETRHQSPTNSHANLSLDGVVRSAEEQQVLANTLDLGFDDGDSGLPGLPPLDLNSELDYSSSPPHTPLGDDDLAVNIRADEILADEMVETRSKPARKRRKHALVDDVTTISRSAKPSAKILRQFSLELYKRPEKPEVTNLIDFNSRVASMLDPEHVYQEMRQRRQIDVSSFSDPLSSEPAELVADDLGFDSDVADSVSENDATMADLSEEMLESEQKQAKQVVKDKLSHRGESAMFDDLPCSKTNKACLLMEVLALAARGKLRPEQSEAFGAIKLVKT